VTCTQQALRDLDRAFVNFFEDLKKPVEQRHVDDPTPRAKTTDSGLQGAT
jgi:hypothetical protein